MGIEAMLQSIRVDLAPWRAMTERVAAATMLTTSKQLRVELVDVPSNDLGNLSSLGLRLRIA